MVETEATTYSDRVYLSTERWQTFLQALQHASQAPCDQAAALRGVVEFLDAVPAVREAGITHPLHQLLAALPDLLRLAACWNQLTAELLASVESDVTMAAVSCAQLRAMLKFANSVAGEPVSKLLVPLAELGAEAVLEAQG
jgi:hypothetical protein